jgi:hypothetical protein
MHRMPAKQNAATSAVQSLVLYVAIVASFMAFLDGSVVNLALPAIGRELGGGLVVQQWVVDAYLLTLGALILVAGSRIACFDYSVLFWPGPVARHRAVVGLDERRNSPGTSCRWTLPGPEQPAGVDATAPLRRA